MDDPSQILADLPRSGHVGRGLQRNVGHDAAFQFLPEPSDNVDCYQAVTQLLVER